MRVLSKVGEKLQYDLHQNYSDTNFGASITRDRADLIAAARKGRVLMSRWYGPHAGSPSSCRSELRRTGLRSLASGDLRGGNTPG